MILIKYYFFFAVRILIPFSDYNRKLKYHLLLIESYQIAVNDSIKLYTHNILIDHWIVVTIFAGYAVVVGKCRTYPHTINKTTQNS